METSEVNPLIPVPVLTLHEIAQTPENLARLLPAFTGKAAFDSDLHSEADIHGIGTLLGVLKNGEVVLTVGLTKVRYTCGTIEAVIVGAAGQVDGCDLVATIMPELEKLAIKAGCTSISFQTRRRGLVAKAAKQGYREASKTLRKAL
jgi:hypothetical protein